MNLDIQEVLQKVRARLGELEMQLIIAESTIELLQGKIANLEAPPQPEAEEE